MVRNHPLAALIIKKQHWHSAVNAAGNGGVGRLLIAPAAPGSWESDSWGGQGKPG